MRTSSGVALLVALLVWGTAGCSTVPSQPGVDGGTSRSGATTTGAYPLGTTWFAAADRLAAPQVRGRTLDGHGFVLSDLRGRVVVLNLWASWCQPCLAESPALAGVSASTAGRGVRFIGVDEHDVAASATAFVRKVGVRYPQVVDSGGAILAMTAQWLPLAVPGTLVIDRRGRVAARIVGPATAVAVQQLIARALDEV